jgi:signal transduction histidine kinase
MRIQSRIWVSIVASVAIWAVGGFFVFSILRGISDDLARGQRYNEIINKAFALNLLVATFKEESGQRDMQQIGDVRRSLSKLLEDVSSSDAREEFLIKQIRRNNQELGPLLDQFVAQRGAPGTRIETERKNMLASQLWTKVRFITDDTNRLMGISQSRIVSAQGKGAVAVLALLVAIILVKTTISYVSGRSIVRDVNRLSEGVGHITGGDLAHRIEVLGKSELAGLASAFNGMAAALQASYDDLREHTRKLEQSNRELQDFAFIASHDLQEPLRKIQTFGDRLREKWGGGLDEEGLDNLERMRNAANRMQALIQALLSYSKVTRRPEPFSQVALTPLLEEVVSDLAVLIEQTGGRIKVTDLPAVEASASQMRQLFQNLLGNGLKFHREERPLIKVSGEKVKAPMGKEASPDSPWVEIRVEDNGIGFDEKYLDRIFHPFQRLHGQSAYDGTGIGLAICRKIVERHGGTITAKSAPDKGATFIVTLPVRQKRVDLDSASKEEGREENIESRG